MGSLNESEYFLFLSKELNYLKEENHNEIVKKLEVVKVKLINLQKKLN